MAIKRHAKLISMTFTFTHLYLHISLLFDFKNLLVISHNPSELFDLFIRCSNMN